MNREHARSLACKTGHFEALDFVDVADDVQLADMIRQFEAELSRDDKKFDSELLRSIERWGA